MDTKSRELIAPLSLSVYDRQVGLRVYLHTTSFSPWSEASRIVQQLSTWAWGCLVSIPAPTRPSSETY